MATGAIVFLTFALACVQAGAQVGSTWSFTDHPPPVTKELPDDEYDRLYPPDRPKDESCEALFARYKEIYATRHADAPVLPVGSSLERRFLRAALEENTDASLGTSSASQGLMCVLMNRLVAAAARFRAETGRHVCSLQMAGLDGFPALADYLAIMREAAASDDLYAVLYASLASSSIRQPHVTYNDDLRAYLFERYDILLPAPERSPDDHGLSPQRLAFVRDAAKRGDLQAVLDTTAPCEP